MIPVDLLYTEEHEWIKIDGDIATIGITDHAQKMLGSITFVELGGAGEEVKTQGVLASIESSKAASDIYSPMDGEVTQVNDALEDQPELVNQDCYGQGWVCKIKLANPADTASLLDAKAYKQYLAEIEE